MRFAAPNRLIAGAPATRYRGAVAHTALARASGEPSSAGPSAHPIPNWLPVAQLQALNRAKAHQLQALWATIGDLT